MQVNRACEEDFPAWLTLALEVEALFGVPLSVDAGFQQALLRNIQRGSAFCVREHDGPAGAALCGGLLFSSKHAPTYELGWLAVESAWRRMGVGRALVEHVMTLIIPPAELTVTTFIDGEAAGAPARRFYLELGFVPAEIFSVLTPPGAARQRFRKTIQLSTGAPVPI
jgi:ribosomal protein S18 acetylase RimI-like enzyme